MSLHPSAHFLSPVESQETLHPPLPEPQSWRVAPYQKKPSKRDALQASPLWGDSSAPVTGISLLVKERFRQV